MFDVVSTLLFPICNWHKTMGIVIFCENQTLYFERQLED